MSMQVEEHVVTGSTSHNLTLNYIPSSPTDVAVDPITGPAQAYGSDFVVNGRILSWDLPNSDIKGVISLGVPVTLRVIYDKA